MKNKKAFTLIELLAVIVILGILLSISTIAVTSIRKKQATENRRNIISGILTGARSYVSYNNTLSSLENGQTTIEIEDIVDSGYASLDTNEYADIYKGVVTVAVCSNNANKIAYSFIDKEEGVTYNDCGCEDQNMNSDSEELCTD